MLRKITYSRTVITTQLKNTYLVVILIKYLHSFHYYFVTMCENQFFSKGKFHIILIVILNRIFILEFLKSTENGFNLNLNDFIFRKVIKLKM